MKHIIKAVVSAHREGQPFSSISQALNISVADIKEILYCLNIDEIPRKRQWSTKFREDTL